MKDFLIQYISLSQRGLDSIGAKDYISINQ